MTKGIFRDIANFPSVSITAWWHGWGHTGPVGLIGFHSDAKVNVGLGIPVRGLPSVVNSIFNAIRRWKFNTWMATSGIDDTQAPPRTHRLNGAVIRFTSSRSNCGSFAARVISLPVSYINYFQKSNAHRVGHGGKCMIDRQTARCHCKHSQNKICIFFCQLARIEFMIYLRAVDKTVVIVLIYTLRLYLLLVLLTLWPSGLEYISKE